MKNLKKDGTFYWIDSNVAPEYDVAGKLIGYTAIRSEITNKKQLEEIIIIK